MIGVFTALDLILFYVFFEAGLIPMFLIIGVWGGPRRVYAAFKFFLYTLLGSVLMLLAMMAMYWEAGTTSIPELLAHPFPAVDADLAVARLPRLVRGEDADVAGPHLAAGRACRGADRRLGGARRDPPEDGRLRLPALLAADVPARQRRARAADLRALDRRHHLHVARRADAGGHEEAHRLFLRGAYGLRHDGHLHDDGAGRAGRHLPDALARHRVGRALPLRRRHLRPHAHARDRRLWRARQPHALVRLRLHGLHHGECRAARHLRLRRRVPDAGRRVPGEHLGRGAGDDRRDPLGLLRALALSPRHLRQAGEGRASPAFST